MTADPANAPYIDTSALAKRYLNEPLSAEFDAYLGGLPSAQISTLTLLEMRCVLARRQRNHELTADHAASVQFALQEDIDLGFLRVLTTEDRHLRFAMRLVDSLGDQGLRALDAMHLGIAESAKLRVLATADVKMARAANSLGMEAVAFF